MSNIGISVVLPVYNESGNLRKLSSDLIKVLDTLDQKYEILFIDDGSIDDSLNIMKDIQNSSSSIVVIEFRRNFGQTAALAAGLRHAEGDIVVTLD